MRWIYWTKGAAGFNWSVWQLFTPLAAGIAALVLSVRPSLGREELKGLLEETADKIGGDYDANGHSNELGFGRVNAGRAVSEARK